MRVRSLACTAHDPRHKPSGYACLPERLCTRAVSMNALLPRELSPRALLPHALLPRALLPHALLPHALLPRALLPRKGACT